MNSITRRQKEELFQLQVQQALGLSRMRGAALVAKTGLSELSKTHMHASAAVERTMATTAHLVASARCVEELSPDRQAAIAQLTQTYLHDMLAVTDEVAAAILDVLLRM